MALAPGHLVAEAPRVGEDEDAVHPRLRQLRSPPLAADTEVRQRLLDAVEVLLVVDAPADVRGLVLLAGMDLEPPLGVVELERDGAVRAGVGHLGAPDLRGHLRPLVLVGESDAQVGQ